MANTISNFLLTANDETYIICPACGSSMGVHKTGSYQFILTNKARVHLNSKIQDFRHFLAGIEKILSAKNNSYSFTSSNPDFYKEEDERHLKYISDHLHGNANAFDGVQIDKDGTYQKLYATEASDIFQAISDRYNWIDKFKDFPSLYSDQNQIIKKCKDILIPASEPKEFNLLMDLIAEQDAVLKLRQKLDKSAFPYKDNSPNRIKGKQNNTEELSVEESIDKLLEQVCPFYVKYLNECKNHMPSSGSNNNDDNDKHFKAIIKLKFVLALLLGHNGSDLNKQFDGAIIEGKAYDLPEQTYCSLELLSKLLKSRLLLEQNFLEASSIKNLLSQKINTDNSNTVWFEDSLLPDVVHFICANKYKSDKHEKVCGWYPKESKTHSVVLLGSPGTGKTSVMTTGITVLYNYTGTIGCTCTPLDTNARNHIDSLRQKYRKGIPENPTPRGSIERIELLIENIAEPDKKAYFVFLDVAGEDVASIITGEAENPEIQRILHNADTMVFFFDFTVEPTIRDILLNSGEEGDKEAWQTLKGNFEAVEKSRGKKISVDQFNLLNELVSLVIREKELADKIRTRFVCVIPKADLFVSNAQNETEKKRYFLTGFFEYLKSKKLIVKSPYTSNMDDYRGMCSLAGIKNESQKFGLDLYREISDQAKAFLCKIGDSFPSTTAPENQVALVTKVEKNLVNFLETRFEQENTYFLPVSALGENPEKSEDGSGLGHQPNQKLSEFVFLIPVMLALESQSTEQS